MPIYEYRCDNGHSFEVTRRMSDDSLERCSLCEAPVQRVFHPVAVHFKGSGFYTTDYGKKKGADPARSESKDSGEGTSPDSPSKDSKGSKGSNDGKSAKGSRDGKSAEGSKSAAGSD